MLRTISNASLVALTSYKSHEDGTSLLFHAISKNMVELLVGVGLDPNARFHGGWTCLHNKLLPVEVVQALVQAGADVNARTEFGNTPLHHIPHAARVLIDAGADVNARNKANKLPVDYRTDRVQEVVFMESGSDASPSLPEYLMSRCIAIQIFWNLMFA